MHVSVVDIGTYEYRLILPKAANPLQPPRASSDPTTDLLRARYEEPRYYYSPRHQLDPLRSYHSGALLRAPHACVCVSPGGAFRETTPLACKFTIFLPSPLGSRSACACDPGRWVALGELVGRQRRGCFLPRGCRAPARRARCLSNSLTNSSWFAPLWRFGPKLFCGARS